MDRVDESKWNLKIKSISPLKSILCIYSQKDRIRKIYFFSKKVHSRQNKNTLDNNIICI